ILHSSHSTRSLHSFPTRRSSDLNFADLLAFNPICLDQTKLFFCSSFARIEETICKESHSPWDTSITAYFFFNSCKRRTKEQFSRSEEHTSELQSRFDLVCRLLLE